MQLPKDPIKLAVLTALAMAVLALAVALSAVLSPFLMAAALAYLLSGWVHRLASAGLPRALAVLLVEGGFMVLVLSLAALVIPEIGRAHV